MRAAVGERGQVALLSAPGFLEDQQVTSFLANELESRGISTFLIQDPSQLIWKDGAAYVCSKRGERRLDAIVRFYQAEWLARLSDASGWRRLFGNCATIIVNAGTSVLTESKRFPLIWEKLSSRLDTWRTFMPESREPAWNLADDWVLKAAFSNTGDEIHLRELVSSTQWKRLKWTVLRNPRAWVAQRRFETVPIASDSGWLYPCIGVYTINGQAAGIYGRVSKRPVVDYSAMDAVVLIARQTSE
jgi:glutathionylspermidine synthase